MSTARFIACGNTACFHRVDGMTATKAYQTQKKFAANAVAQSSGMNADSVKSAELTTPLGPEAQSTSIIGL